MINCLLGLFGGEREDSTEITNKVINKSHLCFLSLTCIFTAYCSIRNIVVICRRKSG